MKCEYPENLKKTKQRLAVFNILNNSDVPLTVSEIYQQILHEYEYMNYSTVYRTVNAFVNAGVVVSSMLPNSDEAVFEIKTEDHRHYAICLNCRKEIPLKSCPVISDINELETENFTVTGHSVALYGYCRDCRKKMKK